MEKIYAVYYNNNADYPEDRMEGLSRVFRNKEDAEHYAALKRQEEEEQEEPYVRFYWTVAELDVY